MEWTEWKSHGGEIEKLDCDEELDYLEIRLQKLESKDYTVRRKSAEALAPYVAENPDNPGNRLLLEVRERFDVQPPHPAEVLADCILGPNSDKGVCINMCQALAHMGPAAASYAAKAVAVCVSHADDELRWEAAHCLGFLGPGAAKEASRLMAKQLDPDKESNENIRFKICRSLGLMGPGAAEGAASALAKALTDKDCDVQNASAVALAQMGPAAAKKAVKALVQAMLEGRFELRRLAMKALISMGEAVAGEAAYPCCRVLNRAKACCRGKYHALEPMHKKLPQMCDQCKVIGPAAKGTHFQCSSGCKWDICMDCNTKLMPMDAELQSLAAEALHAMGPKAVMTCQIYLSRALDDVNEEVRNAARKALEMAGCDIALRGSMALYDPTSCPCGKQNCALCKKNAEVEDEQPLAIVDSSLQPPMLKDDAVCQACEEMPLAEPSPQVDEEHEDSVTTSRMEEDGEEPKLAQDPPLQAEEENEDDISALPTIEEDEEAAQKTTSELPQPETPQTQSPREEPEESESPREVRPDPWGPAEQVSRTKKPYPNLAVDTGHEDRLASKPQSAASLSVSEPSDKDGKEPHEAD